MAVLDKLVNMLLPQGNDTGNNSLVQWGGDNAPVESIQDILNDIEKTKLRKAPLSRIKDFGADKLSSLLQSPEAQGFGNTAKNIGRGYTNLMKAAPFGIGPAVSAGQKAYDFLRQPQGQAQVQQPQSPQVSQGPVAPQQSQGKFSNDELSFIQKAKAQGFSKEETLAEIQKKRSGGR